MRTALAIILAFLVGVGAMLGWNAWHLARGKSDHRQNPGRSSTSASMTASIAAVPINRKPLLTVESPPSPLPNQGWPQAAPTPEQVIYDQPRLLDQELAQLKPRTPGKVNLYALVFAGDGSENVFRNEAKYFDKLFSQRFNAAGHIVVLENNPASLTTRPLADWNNLEASLDAIATKMDLRRDILLLYFTTHGSEDHSLYIDMDPLPLDQLGAQDMAGILREHPFRWRVVIVNACYSGGFIPPLRAAGSMIIAAARSDRSSFGCGEQSQLTWFGHAFLVDALNRTGDFALAFQLARGEVAQWERRNGYAPSEPQIDIGTGIAEELTKWRAGFKTGETVPFHPPAATSAVSNATKN